MHVRRACVRVRVRIGVPTGADETVTLIKVVECVGSEICVLEASRGGVAGVHCRGTTTTDTTAADSKSIRQHRGNGSYYVTVRGKLGPGISFRFCFMFVSFSGFRCLIRFVSTSFVHFYFFYFYLNILFYFFRVGGGGNFKIFF